MRAKITCKTNLTDAGLQTMLEEIRWWPSFAQKSDEAERIKKSILDTVAPDHFKAASEGALMVLYEKRSSSQGLVSREDDDIVFRIASENISVLQATCERLVQFLGDYCRRNTKTLIYTGKIEVLETKNRERVIEGTVTYGKKDRIKRARTEKRIEFTVAWIGLLLFIILLAATFPWSFKANLNNIGEWFFDILARILGSVLVTSLISYLNYRYYLNGLQDITWMIPQIHDKEYTANT